MNTVETNDSVKYAKQSKTGDKMHHVITVQEVQPETLLINGASLVFYSVYVLNTPLDDSALKRVNNNKHYTVKALIEGYTEKIFRLNAESRSDHLVYETDVKTTLPPLAMSTNEFIRPVVKHYITIYSHQIMLIQSIILFDRNNITGFTPTTTITKPITTPDILKIIHTIKNKGEDWNRVLLDVIGEIREDSFLSLINKGEIKYKFIDISDRNQQCLAVQILDIESKKFNGTDEIDGVELAKRYESELSAILSCYTEHFSEEGMWTKISANHVAASVLVITNVLKDHQVRLSERVCVEISQVNHPQIRQLSLKRLNAYGYDSTSIFLWGYIVIMAAAFEFCNIKAIELYDEILGHKQINTWTTFESMRIMNEKRSLIKKLEGYSSIKNLCIEERHERFISTGAKVRGLLDVQEKIQHISTEITELCSLSVAAGTSETSSKINELLGEVRNMNEKDGRTTILLTIIGLLLSIIGLFVAALAVEPINDDLKQLFTMIITTKWWILLAIAIFVFATLLFKEFSGRKK